MKIKNYSGMMESFNDYNEAPVKRQDSAKYIAPGKKAKEKKPDYSEQRKQKRGD
jgi:hypothetical protein